MQIISWELIVHKDDINIWETSSDFQIEHIPSQTFRGMGDGVDRYADHNEKTLAVGTPEFYAAMRADLIHNYSDFMEAYFPEHVNEG